MTRDEKMTREQWRDADWRQRLANAINSCSRENGSMTPDFILAEFLDDCLAAWDKASRSRESWYDQAAKGESPFASVRPPEPPPAAPAPELPSEVRKEVLRRVGSMVGDVESDLILTMLSVVYGHTLAESLRLAREMCREEIAAAELVIERHANLFDNKMVERHTLKPRN